MDKFRKNSKLFEAALRQGHSFSRGRHFDIRAEISRQDAIRLYAEQPLKPRHIVAGLYAFGPEHSSIGFWAPPPDQIRAQLARGKEARSIAWATRGAAKAPALARKTCRL